MSTIKSSAENLTLNADGSGNDIKFQSNGVEKASIDQDGNVVAAGTISSTGDTSAGDDAAIGYTAAEGLILTGQGSTNDITIKNDADQTVISIPTGTRTVQFDSTDDAVAAVLIKSTNGNAASAPDFVLYRLSDSPADADYLAKTVYRGRNDNSQDVEYAQILSQAVDVSDGTEDGRMYLQTKVAGSDVNHIIMDSNGVTTAGALGVGGLTVQSTTAFQVKPADYASSITINNAASNGKPEGSVFMTTQNQDSQGFQGSFAVLNHWKFDAQSEIRIDCTTDVFRGGVSGTYWVQMGLGAQATIGAGWLSIVKATDGAWDMWFDQVVSHGSSPTITLTKTTVSSTVLDGHLRIANTTHTYGGFSITKMGGGSGNGGEVPAFTLHSL